MTASSHEKVFTQLKAKPVILKKFLKHNSPKPRKCGINLRKCRRCGRRKGHISKYGIHLCRQCYREIAVNIGFKQYS